jgi:hypothetical protein
MIKDYKVDDTFIELESYNYQKKIGAYKPDFTGIPDDYYPLTACEVIQYSLFVFFIIVGVLGLMIGCLFWVTNEGLYGFITIWGVVFIIFVLVLMVLFSYGGRGRIR